MLTDKTKLLAFVVLLTSFLSYSFYLYAFQSAPKSNLADADKGKMVWQQYNCVACHQIYRLGGYLGPDLTNTYSTRGPEYIKAFLKNGTTVMPQFNLSDEEVEYLVTFMKDIDASGSSDPRTFTINTNGTISQHQ